MKTIKITLAKVKSQVIKAYTEATRNLNFKASGAVTIDEAVTIMAKALNCGEHEEGYNNFQPACFRKLPEGTEITLAREGSVCAYIKPPKDIPLQVAKLSRAMVVDEFDKAANGTWRLWWD